MKTRVLYLVAISGDIYVGGLGMSKNGHAQRGKLSARKKPQCAILEVMPYLG